MTALGYMPMPADFRYRAVIERGQPSTGKHPRMDTGHRAKIFAPFAALRGFDQAILSKDTLYEPKRMLAEDERAELNRRFTVLHNLTYNGRMARANKPVVTMEYFVPCADRNHEAYGYGGNYTEIKGIVWNVDFVGGTVRLGKTTIRMADIARIEADGLFDRDWEYDAV